MNVWQYSLEEGSGDADEGWDECEAIEALTPELRTESRE